MYFNVNFNVFFKLIKVHLLVSELYMRQSAQCNDIKKTSNSTFYITFLFSFMFLPFLLIQISLPKLIVSLCRKFIYVYYLY